MIKVLFLAEQAPGEIGGIQSHQLALMRNLDYIGIQSVSYSAADFGVMELFDKVVPCPWQVFKAVRESDAEIMHIHGFMSIFVFLSLAACGLYHKKIIYTPHSHPFDTLRRPLLAKISFYVCIRPLMHKVKTLIALTHSELAFWRTMLNEKNEIVVIPNGVDIPNKKNHKEKEDLILFVGSNLPHKRLDFFVLNKELFRRMGYKPIVVSKDGKEYCSSNGVECYSDLPAEKLRALFDRSKILVIPSSFEAFGIVALEALAHNVAVIATDSVGCAEYFSNYWWFRTFPCDDAALFEDALIEVCHALSLEGRFDALKQLRAFTWREIARQVGSVYINSASVVID